MKLKYSREELEAMPYDDLAYMILKEKGKKMKTIEIFTVICKNLDLDINQYEDKIADFFTLLATEKRFIQLQKGYWDLKENHTSDIKIEETVEESEEDDDIDMELKTPVEEEETPDYYDTKEDDDDDADDGLGDLVIIDELEEEE